MGGFSTDVRPEFTQFDEAFDAMVDAARLLKGTDAILDFSQVARSIVGLPIPLCFAYLIGADVWPLCRLHEFFGEPGSGKTSLQLEVGRWHCCHHGRHIVAETENKTAAGLMQTLYTPDLQTRALVVPADSMEEWQGQVTYWLDRFTSVAEKKLPEPTTKLAAKVKKVRKLSEVAAEAAAAEKNKAKKKAAAAAAVIGYLVPCSIAVDSLMAVCAESAMDKVNEEGYATAGFPREALLIKSYLQTTSRAMRGKPYSLIAINHLKKGITATGIPIDSVPGGAMFKFMATVRLKAHRKDFLIYAGADCGMSVELRSAKSSMGPPDRRILVDCYWKRGRVNDQSEEALYAFWDWPSATIKMLLDRGNDKTLMASIQEAVDLKPVSGKRVVSRRLGFSEDSPGSYHDVGLVLENSPLILKDLKDALHIARYAKFTGGCDFKDFVRRSIAGEVVIEDPPCDIYYNDYDKEVFSDELADAENVKSVPAED